jgi:hypothetical protein
VGLPSRAPNAAIEDSGVEDRRLLDELETLFANDASLAASEKQTQEGIITKAFASFQSVTFLEPVECKERLCRLTIQVPSADDLNKVLVAMVGVPGPDNPEGKALLPYGLVNPNHKVLPDRSATATVFVKKASWSVLRGSGAG